MATYNLTAVQTPTPLAPPTPSFGNGGSPPGPFTTGQTYPPPGTSSVFNQVVAGLLLMGQQGSGGYGIFTGGALSAPAGLTVAIAPGIFLIDGIVELVSGTPVGNSPFYQVKLPVPYGLANNATNYVWLTNTGSLISSTSLAPPANARIFLGTVTTVAGAITNIDASGVLTIANGKFTRQTADIGMPTDVPPGMPIVTLTTTGYYTWSNNNHILQPPPALNASINSTQTLTPLSPRTFFYKVTGGADVTVKLPLSTLLPPGFVMAFYSSPDSTHNVLIKDSTGVTTFATITPGQVSGAATYPGTGGGTIWPATWTSGTPVGGPGMTGGGGAG